MRLQILLSYIRKTKDNAGCMAINSASIFDAEFVGT